MKRFAGGGAWVYVVRKRRVVAVGVASRALVRDKKELRRAARRLGRATATQQRATFVPNPKQEGEQPTGRALAAQNERQLDPQTLALLCRLQAQR